jgi:hypothetical protein
MLLVNNLRCVMENLGKAKIIRMTIFLSLMIFLSHSNIAQALPRYSAKYAQSCFLCHNSPAGGGMRNEYGSQFFAGTELAEKTLDFDKLDLLDSKLSDRVSIGFDFRGVYQQEANSGDPEISLVDHERSTFFQMQGDLYLSFKLDKRFNVVLDKGLSSGYEIWGQAAILPHNGSLRVGRFVPFFGWKSVDHETFTRSRTGMGRDGVDTGVELEFHPQHWSFSLALGNGANSTFDGNKGKSLTSRLAWQSSLGKHNLSLGLNGRVNDVSPAESTTIAGLFGAYNKGAFSWLWEADLVDRKDQGLAISNELSYQLKQGLDLVYNSDFWDADIDEKSGFETRQRLSLDYIPYPFFALQPGLSLYQTNDGNNDENWFLMDLQFYFFM